MMNSSKLYKRFMRLEVVLASSLLFIPLILILVTKEVRPSLSNYAYSAAAFLYAVLLSTPGIMFFYNGWLTKKHYNNVLGICLIGVVLTPHLDYSFWHYVFAGLFFLGSCFVMVFFSSEKQRKYKIAAAAIIVVAMIGHFVSNWYSLLVAEWIGMLPISIHFIGESLKKID